MYKGNICFQDCAMYKVFLNISRKQFMLKSYKSTFKFPVHIHPFSPVIPLLSVGLLLIMKANIEAVLPSCSL